MHVLYVKPTLFINGSSIALLCTVPVSLLLNCSLIQLPPLIRSHPSIYNNIRQYFFVVFVSKPNYKYSLKCISYQLHIYIQLSPDLSLKGEFTNFDNVILNDAPRQYSNILEGLRIWSPLKGVIVFLRGPQSNRCFGGRFWAQFSL